MHYILLCKSLTSAQRAARALNREGIFASVTKAPQGANPGGCAYGVKIGERNYVRARTVLERERMRPARVFALPPGGEIYEVAL